MNLRSNISQLVPDYKNKCNSSYQGYLFEVLLAVQALRWLVSPADLQISAFLQISAQNLTMKRLRGYEIKVLMDYRHTFFPL